MPKPDYSKWLTKQQAAEAIGCSTKTVEKLADEKKLHRAYWKRPETGATIAVYHPDDVNRLRAERNPGAEPFVLPPSSENSEKAGAVVRAQPSAEQFFRALAAVAGIGSESSQKHSAVRIAERLFLTIPEAADFSGLPQTHLRRLMEDGKLQGVKTGAGWRIRRADLEKL